MDPHGGIPGRRFESVQRAPGRAEAGQPVQSLFKGEPGELGNFEISVSLTTPSEEVKRYPRHHHIFEQLRMTLVGTPEWTPRTATPPGWVIYVGAGTFYGPYDRQAGHEQLHIQFEGANCPPFPGYEALMASRDALAAKGSFEKGFFVWTDEEGKVHRQEGTRRTCSTRSAGRSSTRSRGTPLRST